MRADEIIFEATTNKTRKGYMSRKSNWQKLEKALPRLEPAINKFNQGIKIFRGLRNPYQILFKPQMPWGIRPSRNTLNYYTLFVDNSPMWAKFPPRSSSVICTTNYDTAYAYGRPYVILPEGDPAIGVAPTQDFWFSFGQRLLDHKSLDSLNWTIKYIVRDWLKISDFQPKSWEEFEQVLEQIDKINFYSFPNLPPIPTTLKGYDAKLAISLLSLNPGTTMEQKLSWLLDPTANNFQLTNLSTFNVTGKHEIWLTAPCWFIDYDSIKQSDDLAKLIQEMSATHGAK